MKKVTVIGAGAVGATAAQRILEKDLAHVVLIDVVEGLAAGKALDMMQSGPVEHFSGTIIGTTDYALSANSDVIVVTAGLARKPGMSRDDLLRKNAAIVREVVERTARLSPAAVIMMVTNPLDVMAHLAYTVSRFDWRKVIGMAGVLDSARYRAFVADALGVLPSEVEAVVLGGHGDAMVPLARYCTVKGRPLTELLDSQTIRGITERTKNGGAEIVSLLKTGSAYYAPSSSVVAMVAAVLRDTREVMPCSVYLQGSYGLRDVYCGVPVRLGKDGVQEIVELPLGPEEAALLSRSSEGVRDMVRALGIVHAE